MSVAKDVLGSAVPSEGASSMDGSASGDEAKPSGTVDSVDKAVAIKKRRSSTRKPRTKGVTKKLQEQLEFYFGESNLPKDKFLKEQIAKNGGYVPVEVLANFKKMKSLSTDQSLILKAIKNSSMLELCGDSHGVRRSCPLPDVPQSDVDLRTVYVENLSVSSTDHDSVSKMFKFFGDVKYVSLPRYKTSGTIKGFAFVEFATQEAATKAVEFFRLKDTLPVTQRSRKPSKIIEEVLEKASSSETVTSLALGDEGMVVPDNMEQSGSEVGKPCEEGMAGVAERVATTEGGEGGGGVVKGVANATEDGGSVDSEHASNSGVPEEMVRGEVARPLEGRKRKREEEEEGKEGQGEREGPKEEGGKEGVEEGEENGRKRIRREKRDKVLEETKGRKKREGEDLEVTPDVSSESNSGRKREREVNSESSIVEEDTSDLPFSPPIKRSKLETISEDDTEVSEVETGTERGKKEGVQESSEQGPKKKRLRQRSRKKQWPPGLKECNLRVMAKMEWLNMKEMFKNLQKTHMKSVKSETAVAAAQSRERGFVKDCLVKVELEQEWEESHRSGLKEFCEHHGQVAFIDLKLGDTMGYVRFRMSGCVDGVVQASDKPPGTTFSAVKEEDERAYFLKTQAERKQRARTGKKGMNQRGKDKLVSRALKRTAFVPVPPTRLDGPSSPQQQPMHIKFTDSD